MSKGLMCSSHFWCFKVLEFVRPCVKEKKSGPSIRSLCTPQTLGDCRNLLKDDDWFARKVAVDAIAKAR